MKLEVLHVTDCPNVRPMLDRLAEATDLPVARREVTSDAEAARLGMRGSPTLLINGIDPFASSDQGASGLSCRLYHDQERRIVRAPSVDQLRDAIAGAEESTPGPPLEPGEVLSAWRRRAAPLDPVEKAVHQEILRIFAATGQPPAPSELDATATGRAGVGAVLSALHEADAIRLDADGSIVVAYPFSSHPTRHRVRIDDRVDVYAMCAVDALGISAMLGQDTRIESLDVTSGAPINIVMNADGTTWDPATAVVFVGAAAGGGPSSECCCDYLNFFTDPAAAGSVNRGAPGRSRADPRPSRSRRPRRAVVSAAARR